MSSTRSTWADKMVADALNDPAPLLSELNAENDELAVSERIAAGKYNTWQSSVASEWLRRKSDARLDDRDAETLSIAREANRLASEANSIARLEAQAAARSARYAMYAAVIAAIGAIAAVIPPEISGS